MATWFTSEDNYHQSGLSQNTLGGNGMSHVPLVEESRSSTTHWGEYKGLMFSYTNYVAELHCSGVPLVRREDA